jgi:hypothetical protein
MHATADARPFVEGETFENANFGMISAADARPPMPKDPVIDSP